MSPETELFQVLILAISKEGLLLLALERLVDYCGVCGTLVPPSRWFSLQTSIRISGSLNLFLPLTTQSQIAITATARTSGPA